MSETLWVYSICMTIPAALQAQANQLAEGLGHGPGNFSNPLSATGEQPATHYGCFTSVQESFVQLLTAAGQGTLPQVEGMTPEEVGLTMMSLVADVQYQTIASEHIASFLEAQGLVMVASEEAI
jgi:hypothetical protein